MLFVKSRTYLLICFSSISALFFQVIKLFEEFTLPQIVVTMATSAISIADEDDPNVVSILLLCVFVFQNHKICALTFCRLWYLNTFDTNMLTTYNNFFLANVVVENFQTSTVDGTQ